MKFNSWKTIPIHPFFFSIYPVLSLYIINFFAIPFNDFFKAILLIFIPSIIVWASLTVLTHDLSKSAAIVSIFLFMFFSYRYFLLGITNVAYAIGFSRNFRNIVETKIGLLCWFLLGALIYFAIVVRIIKNIWNMKTLAIFLNLFSCVLVVISLLDWILPNIRDHSKDPIALINQFQSDWPRWIENEDCLLSKRSMKLPSIYYIILDGYGREDVLSQMYHVDISNFITYLEQNGFYVAKDSKANYKHTKLALASYLNFDYVENLAVETNLDTNNENNLPTLIAYNRTFHQLRCLGYQVVSFSTGFSGTDINTSDTKYSLANTATDLENLLINNSPLSIIFLDKQYNWHRERILYTLDELPKIAKNDGNNFVFVHIVAPHPPFVFAKDGTSTNPQREFAVNDANDFREVGTIDEYVEGYSNQVTYISKKVAETIDGILKNSKTEPIIIVQGDHGPASELDTYDIGKTDLWERMSIFNAYYFPDKNYFSLYPGITPVNSFRVVFNNYFGGAFSLLEDKSFYTSGWSNYERIDITELIPHNRFDK